MIIWKIPAHPDVHFQKEGPSSVTRGVTGQKEEKKEMEKEEKEEKEEEKKFLYGPTKGSTRGPRGP